MIPSHRTALALSSRKDRETCRRWNGGPDARPLSPVLSTETARTNCFETFARKVLALFDRIA